MTAPAASTTLETVAFITDLLECSPVQRSSGDDYIWSWSWNTTSHETVHVIGFAGSAPVVFVDVSGVQSDPPEDALHFAIIGWCARSGVLCVVDEWGDRYALLSRRITEVGSELPRVVHRGSRRMQ